MTADEMLEEYRRWAIRYGESDDPEIANAAHARLIDVVRMFRDTGQGRRILELLHDDSEYVRARAAFDALYLSPDDGISVLRELAEGPPGKLCVNAFLALDQRERGELVLYPWEGDDQAEAEDEHEEDSK